MLLVHPSVHVQRKLKFLKRRGVAAVIWLVILPTAQPCGAAQRMKMTTNGAASVTWPAEWRRRIRTKRCFLTSRTADPAGLEVGAGV